MNQGRRVGHLRLRAPDSGAARRGQFLIEDALRTASIPEAEAGRLLLIRRLDLGRIVTTASPSQISRQVELCIRQIAISAVPWSATTADDATAVWFPDVIAPLAALAVHAAKGGSGAAWFWRAALPSPRPKEPTALLRAVLIKAAQTPPTGIPLAQVMAAVRQAGVLDTALRLISHADAVVLLQTLGISPTRSTTERTIERTQSPSEFRPRLVPTAWRAAVRRWAPIWGPDSPRLRWLIAVGLIAERPELATAALTPRIDATVEWVQESIESSLAPVTQSPAVISPRPVAPIKPPNIQADLLQIEPLDQPPAQLDTVAEQQRSAEAQTKMPRRSPPPAPPSTAQPAPPTPIHQRPRPNFQWDHGIPQPTEFGGLYFLIPVLQRLGIEAALSENEALHRWQLPARILDVVAQTLGAPPDDPIRPTIEPLKVDPPCPFTVPSEWQAFGETPQRRAHRRGDPSAGILIDDGGLVWRLWRPLSSPEPESAGGESDLATLAQSWMHAADRWLCHFTDLDLATLVCRGAGVLRTRTHTDLLFDFEDADIRIRRPALDINPGWVPWFGRIITFHYLAGGRRDCD